MSAQDQPAKTRHTGAPRGLRIAGAILMCLGIVGCTATPSATSAAAPKVDVEPLPSHDAVLDGQGSLAFSSGLSGDIYFVSPVKAAHRVLGADGDDLDQVCPAFSPDGARLASGQASGHSQIGWRHPALVITDLSASGEPNTSLVVPIGGITNPPCPVWSPDGRWVAFNTSWWPGEPWGTGGVVRIVEVATGEIRRLPEVAAADIEWAPNGGELYIADRRGIVVYSIATEEMRTISDTEGSVALTASPDGTRLAVERRHAGIWNQYDLWLIGADGSDRRLIAEKYTHHEWAIGPVWSPDGKRIVFQRSTDDPAHGGDQTLLFRKDEEVVIVTVGADDPLGPVGTQYALRPTVTAHDGEAVHWLPVVVTWAPDSRNLRFVGWRAAPSDESGESWAVLAVPVDAGAETTILWETPDLVGSLWIHPLNDSQSWTRSTPGPITSVDSPPTGAIPRTPLDVDPQVWINDLPTGQPALVPYFHDRVLHVSGVEIEPLFDVGPIFVAGRTVLVGGEPNADGTPTTWWLVDGDRLEQIPPASDEYYPALSADGRIAYWQTSRGGDTTFVMWDTQANRELATHTVAGRFTLQNRLQMIGVDAAGVAYWVDQSSDTPIMRWDVRADIVEPTDLPFNSWRSFDDQAGPLPDVFRGQEDSYVSPDGAKVIFTDRASSDSPADCCETALRVRPAGPLEGVDPGEITMLQLPEGIPGTELWSPDTDRGASAWWETNETVLLVAVIEAHSYLVRCWATGGSCELVFDLGASSEELYPSAEWEQEWAFADFPVAQ